LEEGTKKNKKKAKKQSSKKALLQRQASRIIIANRLKSAEGKSRQAIDHTKAQPTKTGSSKNILKTQAARVVVANRLKSVERGGGSQEIPAAGSVPKDFASFVISSFWAQYGTRSLVRQRLRALAIALLEHHHQDRWIFRFCEFWSVFFLWCSFTLLCDVLCVQ
jgi:hypothetical protein